ncbi:hypothetical protein A3H38_00545 [candidate division WOR-1 bacterium RIFCSPLOWO2_02_FULL_46_20]|uniref:Transposase n=2 Tax=Saganbacteria TaxID=1703751 RepID=A0A1F4RF26_UNCSA|nr:MAG: hypothetical protein A3J44_02210 [candidate division WOR-1 bacterium RIFCSPHIGHO2_02_FULL_45_12]OGC06779.1 MAG: hypothetical protein A3H38_00545 [candidate division WOR-1 bacterium RIFCSPLOWO2_02_FULL_46_20]OGC07906.1 MAG: hypothetical protein A3F86_03180 [candidate division WOR-1 bacterium RIFCSPLOWO2_12_FULL_45_9]
MKPWEVKKTREKLNNLSPGKSLRIFFDLYQAGLKILRDSLLAEKPNLSARQLKWKMNKLAEVMQSL